MFAVWWQESDSERRLLLWSAGGSTNKGRIVHVKGGNNKVKFAKCNPTVLHLFPYGFTGSSSSIRRDTDAWLIHRKPWRRPPPPPPRLSRPLPLLCLWGSEAEGIVPEWAETAWSVSVGAVPVGFCEPVVWRHPSVQDLGVSTRHCQSEETEEEMMRRHNKL